MVTAVMLVEIVDLRKLSTVETVLLIVVKGFEILVTSINFEHLQLQEVLIGEGCDGRCSQKCRGEGTRPWGTPVVC